MRTTEPPYDDEFAADRPSAPAMSTLTPATELAATNTVRQLNESPEYRAARQDPVVCLRYE